MLGEQRFQDAAGGLLMKTVLRGSRCGTEGLIEEGDPNTFHTAYLLECGRRPRLALDHLGKQGQAQADDFAILGQLRHSLIEEALLLARQAALRQGAKGPTEGRQDRAGVPGIEEIDRRRVLVLKQRYFQLAQKARDRHPEVITHQEYALEVLSVTLP